MAENVYERRNDTKTGYMKMKQKQFEIYLFWKENFTFVVLKWNDENK